MSHSRFLNKIATCNIFYPSLSWFSSYPSSRSQVVHANDDHQCSPRQRSGATVLPVVRERCLRCYSKRRA